MRGLGERQRVVESESSDGSEIGHGDAERARGREDPVPLVQRLLERAGAVQVAQGRVLEDVRPVENSKSEPGGGPPKV